MVFHNVTPLHQGATQTPKTTGQTRRSDGQRRGGQTTPTSPHGRHQAEQTQTHSTNDRNEEHPRDENQDEERPRSRQHATHEPPGTEEQGRATARSQATATKNEAHAPSDEEQQQSARRKPTQETPPKKFGFPTAQRSRVVLAQPGLTLDRCAIQYLFFWGCLLCWFLVFCCLMFGVLCFWLASSIGVLSAYRLCAVSSLGVVSAYMMVAVVLPCDIVRQSTADYSASASSQSQFASTTST